MNKYNKSMLSMIAVGCLVLLSACAPEVGSEPWCAEMKEKPKADWTANETTEFAKNCIFK